MTLSDKAKQIVAKRYLYDDETSWSDVAQRVGHGVGGKGHGDEYANIINDLLFIPGGRILRNIGRPRGSLFNCYCLPIGDSREEIGTLFKNALMLWGEGGGVGINFSTLRPRGETIKGVGGQSSGLVSFMRAVDGIAATVESGGQRRAASLGLCEVWHPEVEGFINAKKRDGEISYFNISVGLNDEYIDAVRQEEQWSLSWLGKEARRLDANSLWQNMVDGAWTNGEPGFINMSNLAQNNSYYFAPVRGTNPCGETCLEDYGVCNLGSLVLPKFVQGGRTQWSKLREVIRHAVRFLDTCIDLNKYVITEIKHTATQGRRIGIGVMGLADMLFALGLRYGSRSALDYIESLFKFIRNTCYEVSCELARELGTFPKFDSRLYCKAKFIKSLPVSLRQDIRKYGTRNVTLMAMAPTGTISLIPEVSSGVEPLLYKAYTRTDRVSIRTYVHPLIGTFENDIPDWFVDSTDLTPKDHIETQVAVQKYTDGAVSKTILIEEDFPKEELSDILLESMDDLKGCTVYRNNSRDGQIISPIGDLSNVKEFETSPDKESVQCATGNCEI